MFLHDFGRVASVVIVAAMVVVQIGAMVMRVWSGRWTDRRPNGPAYLRACGAVSVLLFATLAALCWAGAASADQPAMRLALTLLLAASGVSVSAWHGMANTSVFAVCFVTPLSIPHLMALQGWPLVWLAASACALVATPLLVARAAGAKHGELALKTCAR